MSSELRLYFDESVELAVSEQLAAGGLDVVSAHSLEVLGDEDRNHLERATAMGRVLCTYGADFLRLASEGVVDLERAPPLARADGVSAVLQLTSSSSGTWTR